MRLNLSWKLYADFSVALLTLAIISLFAFRGTQTLVSNQDDVTRSQAVLEGLENIVGALKDAETGQREFLITGEDRHLAPYDTGIAVLNDHIVEVQSLTSDSPAQQQRIEEMKPFVQEKLDVLAETIGLRRTEGFEAAQAVVLTDAGRTSADAIRRITDEMTAEEVALLDARAASTASSASMVKNVILGGRLVAVIITGAVAFFLSRSIADGVGQVAAALKAISVGNLGVKVDIKSKDELGDLAAAYQDMQAYLGDVPWAAEHIADGSPTDEAKPESDDDVRANALAEMTNDQNDALSQVRESADSAADSRNSWRPPPARWGWTPGQLVSSEQEAAGSIEQRGKAVVRGRGRRTDPGKGC